MGKYKQTVPFITWMFINKIARGMIARAYDIACSEYILPRGVMCSYGVYIKILEDKVVIPMMREKFIRKTPPLWAIAVETRNVIASIVRDYWEKVYQHVKEAALEYAKYNDIEDKDEYVNTVVGDVYTVLLAILYVISSKKYANRVLTELELDEKEINLYLENAACYE